MIEKLRNKFGTAIISSADKNDMPEVIVDRDKILDILLFLKNDSETPFNLFLDVCGVDYSDQKPRFEVVYHLYSLVSKGRIRIRVKLHEEDLKIKTAVSVYPIANWFEREAYEMFGIDFEGHPNLQRLLTWEEFEGHPLRKDYPINKRQPIPEPIDIV